MEAVAEPPHRIAPAAVFHNPAIACIVMRLAKNLTKKYISGNTLSYNDNPSIEDYIKVGGLTKQQVKYFIKFCRGGFKGSVDMITEWKVKKSLSASVMHPDIVFRDSWDRSIRSVLRNNINKIEITKPVTILLYGLSHRIHGSNKCTIPLSTSDMVTSKPIWNRNRSVLQIGVSFDRRHMDSSVGLSFTNAFGKVLVSEIQKQLQEV